MNRTAKRHDVYVRRSSRRMCWLLPVLLLGGPSVSQALPPLNVSITADNAYHVGTGTLNAITDYELVSCISGKCSGGPNIGAACTPATVTTDCPADVENCVAADIFNCATGPETWYTTASGGFYYYIVAWSDDAVTQGLLATFYHSGGGIQGTTHCGSNWEVFATGIDVDSCDGGTTLPPPLGSAAGPVNSVNYQIALANADAGPPTSSIGWVNENGPVGVAGTGFLVFGENNTSPQESPANPPPGCPPVTLPIDAFQQACPYQTPPRLSLTTAPQWMWYDSGTGNPFTPGFNHKEYLIFRIQVNQIDHAGSEPSACVDTVNCICTEGLTRDECGVIDRESQCSPSITDCGSGRCCLEDDNTGFYFCQRCHWSWELGAECTDVICEPIPTVSGWGLLVLTLLLLVGTKVYFGRRRADQVAA